MTTYNQPTKAMTRKQFWNTMATGTITIAAFIVGYGLELKIPPGVEAAATAMAGAMVGYMVRDRA